MICLIFYNFPELFRISCFQVPNFTVEFLCVDLLGFDTIFLYSRICSRYSRCVSSGALL